MKEIISQNRVLYISAHRDDNLESGMDGLPKATYIHQTSRHGVTLKVFCLYAIIFLVCGYYHRREILDHIMPQSNNETIIPQDGKASYLSNENPILLQSEGNDDDLTSRCNTTSSRSDFSNSFRDEIDNTYDDGSNESEDSNDDGSDSIEDIRDDNGVENEDSSDGGSNEKEGGESADSYSGNSDESGSEHSWK